MAEPMVLSRVRPYFGRIAVIESPVDEVERPSGLVVPIETERDDIQRGIIVAIDESEEYVRERLREGVVVYFSGGVHISDLIFLQSSQIIAYEEPEA